MSSALPHMPLYWADLLADTAHLSAAELGGYMLLIGNMWQRGKPLSNAGDRLRVVCRMSEVEWTASKPVLAELFQIDGDTWRHKRVEAELARAREKTIKARANRRGGSAIEQPQVDGRSTDDQRPCDGRATADQRPFDYPEPDPEPEDNIISAPIPESRSARVASATREQGFDGGLSGGGGSRQGADLNAARPFRKGRLNSLGDLAARGEGFGLDMTELRDRMSSTGKTIASPEGYLRTLCVNALLDRCNGRVTRQVAVAAMDGKPDAAAAVYGALVLQ